MSSGNEKLCPCCGKYELGSIGEYDMCENCKWFDDPIQRSDPNYKGGRNKMSLNQAKKAFFEGKEID